MAWALIFRSPANSTYQRSGEDLMEVDIEGSGHSTWNNECKRGGEQTGDNYLGLLGWLYASKGCHYGTT
mgnify:FL=1